MLFGNTLQKGLDSLSDCLKKCANAGMGISSANPVDLAATAVLGKPKYNINIRLSLNEYIS